MKTSGRVVSCCVALILALTSVSAVQRLNSINDLKKINFGQSVPKHSLVLLHWFANTVDIDNTDVIRLTFNPNGDYGSHRYRNIERVLDPLPQGGYSYYTVGNLNHNFPRRLPSYVTRPPVREYEGRNRDRIIFRVREHNTGQQDLQTVDEVYITQHGNLYTTSYDPAYTYQITINLLREIRLFSVEGNDTNSLSELRDDFGSNAELWDLINTWGNLACLGLLLFIVTQEKHLSNQRNNRSHHEARRNPDFFINIPEKGQNDVSDARRNTQRDFFVNIPENGQENRNMNYENNDCSQCCYCLCTLLFVLVVLVVIFLCYYWSH